MLQLRFAPFVLFIYFLTFQRSTVECRPRIQRILVHGHEWTVPDEPGWEDVVKKADVIRHQLLSNCATTRDCRLAAEQLRQFFLKHPVASKIYEDSIESNATEDDEHSIFKWG